MPLLTWGIAAIVALGIIGGAYVKGRSDGYDIAKAELVESYEEEIARRDAEAVKQREAAVIAAEETARREGVIEGKVRAANERARQIPDSRVCDLPTHIVLRLNAVRSLTQQNRVHAASAPNGP